MGEVDSENLAKQSGSFSGSGTPQYEFGAEASRTMWRVALDAIFYPEEANTLANEFLKPIHQKLYEGFDGVSDWTESTLQTCSHVWGSLCHSAGSSTFNMSLISSAAYPSPHP